MSSSSPSWMTPYPIQWLSSNFICFPICVTHTECRTTLCERARERASPLNYYNKCQKNNNVPVDDNIYTDIYIYISTMPQYYHKLFNDKFCSYIHSLTRSFVRSLTDCFSVAHQKAAACVQRPHLMRSSSPHMCECVFVLLLRKTCFNKFCTFWPVMWVS